MPTPNPIEIILRAIIINDDRILLCQPHDKSYYYLPGGHLEKGETLENSLKRELKEEAAVEVKSMQYLDLKEHFFDDQHGNHHELNLIYKVELVAGNPKDIICQEDHFIFTWVDITKLKEINLLPPNIKELLLNYLK